MYTDVVKRSNGISVGALINIECNPFADDRIDERNGVHYDQTQAQKRNG